MDVLIWLIIALCFFVYVTVLWIKSLKRKEPFWRSIKRWIVNVIDVFSGGP